MVNDKTLAAIGRVIFDRRFILGFKIVIAALGGWMLASRLERGWDVGVGGAIAIFIILDVQHRWGRYRESRQEKKS